MSKRSTEGCITKLTVTFANRKAAGRALARELSSRDWTDLAVLALPRGGVPVACEITCELSAPLDLAIVRKLGEPGHEEYTIGQFSMVTIPKW